MSDFIPPPRPYELLPPLLACLPTAFVSPRPPPALLPLLTPILRQRIHLLAATASSSDNWLLLLSWDTERASKLPDVVEKLQIEPHPVSGEVEIEDPSQILFRRLDGETLHCKLELNEYELVAIYLWCLGDDEGNEKGWKLAELRSAEDFEDGSTWYGSISESNEQAATAARTSHTNGHVLNVPSSTRKDSPQYDDDDSYWNAYDRSPGRTPSTKRTPPPATSSVQMPTADELEYFSRYMNEVQPALDSEDPDEPTLQPHESTLSGNSLIPQQQADVHHEPVETSNLGPRGYDSSFPTQAAIPDAVRSIDEIRSPRPSSSGDVSPVEELERRARSSSSAEFGIKQHISTDIKSLYRLARSAGIDKDEFERIVKTELDMLGFMDKED